MNITINTPKLNTYQRYNSNLNNNNQFRNNNISFGVKIPTPGKSQITKPFDILLDKLSNIIGDKWTAPIYTSKLATWLEGKTKDSDSVIPVMSVIGSAVISGMYMSRTLTNDQLDERRKKTLAVNQGLTFTLSTLLSLVANKLIDEWWEGLTVKYAQSRLKDKDFAKNFASYNEKLVIRGEKALKTIGYLKKFCTDNETLIGRVNGMGIFKSLAVFGFIYRYFSPVVVTPFANMLGNKWFSGDKKNDEKKA